jgi:hypothetical protein
MALLSMEPVELTLWKSVPKSLIEQLLDFQGKISGPRFCVEDEARNFD